MADLDTPAKRAAALNQGRPFYTILPFPRGSLGVQERQHLLALFAHPGAAEPVIPDVKFTFGARQVTRFFSPETRERTFTARKVARNFT